MKYNFGLTRVKLTLATLVCIEFSFLLLLLYVITIPLGIANWVGVGGRVSAPWAQPYIWCNCSIIWRHALERNKKGTLNKQSALVIKVFVNSFLFASLGGPNLGPARFGFGGEDGFGGSAHHELFGHHWFDRLDGNRCYSAAQDGRELLIQARNPLFEFSRQSKLGGS